MRTRVGHRLCKIQKNRHRKIQESVCETQSYFDRNQK